MDMRTPRELDLNKYIALRGLKAFDGRSRAVIGCGIRSDRRARWSALGFEAAGDDDIDRVAQWCCSGQR
jgi:hypothetical protein